MFIETGLMFLSVPALIAMKFTQLYNWSAHSPPFYCEPHIEKLLADELMILPLRGYRNDKEVLNEQNLEETFQFGLDYLTHASPSLYKLGLKMNGIDL